MIRIGFAFIMKKQFVFNLVAVNSFWKYGYRGDLKENRYRRCFLVYEKSAKREKFLIFQYILKNGNAK